MEAPLQWACLGPTRPAAPTNGTLGAAGDTSRPLQIGRFVGAAHSPVAPGVAICRGGSITSRPYKCPTYKYLRFIGAAQSPAAPTNDPRIKNCSPFFLLGSLTPTREKRFVATGQIFLGAAGDGATPTVACSGSTRPIAPTNGIVGGGW